MNLVSKFFGSDEHKNREAHVHADNDGIYIVEFWKNFELVETRKMNPDGIPRSLRYAEDAAENWVMGYIP